LEAQQYWDYLEHEMKVGLVISEHVYRHDSGNPGLALPEPQTAGSVQSTLFHSVMFFLPREIRSPWYDHLLEDRERMTAGA
jgi:hypothetical protein